MANTLNLKLEEYKKVLTTLESALKEEKNELVRDAVIKRFEYTFELCWKTSKIFLNEKFGVDVFSPKQCFRELQKNKLLSDKETETLLQETNDGNQIIHAYGKNFSEELYEKIKKNYYQLLEKY